MTEVTKKRPTIAFFVSELEGDYSEALCNGMIDAAKENDVNLVILPGKTIKMSYAGQYNYNVIYEYVNNKNVDALVISSATLCGCVSVQEFSDFCLRNLPLPIVSIGIPISGISNVYTNTRPGLEQMINHLIKVHGKRRIAFIKGPEGHSEAAERLSIYRETLKNNGLDYVSDLIVPGDFTVHSVEKAIKTLVDDRKVSFDAIMAANDEMALAVLESLRKRNILVPDHVAVTGFDNGEGAKHATPSLTTVKQPIYEQSRKAMEIALELIKGKKPGDVVFDTEMIIRESCGCLSETMQAFNYNKDFEPESTADGNFELEQIVSRFITKNLGPIDDSAVKISFLRSFLRDCFRMFHREGLEPAETEKILGSFKSAININDLKEDDILTIQKMVTALKKWLDMMIDIKNRFIVEDFFQRLRVMITDTLIKMQGIRLNSHHLEIHHLRGLLVEMVSRTHDYHEQLQSIVPVLRAMGINNCYVFLYDQPVIYRQNVPWHNPPTVKLVMAYNDENWTLEENCRRLSWEKILNNELLPRNKRHTLILNPLFVKEEHMGLILMEFNMPDNYMFESLVIEMSCALKLSLLFYEREQINNQLQEAVKELEDYNQKLNNISQTDELTGLYNRRGFFNLAKQGLNRARERGGSGLLLYADMDGLKKINDQFGHDEGDIAIKAMGEILGKTFRAVDIVSRFGGDEFTIFMVDAGSELLPGIKERLLEYTTEYNHQSGKPYQIAITIGAIPFKNNEDVTLENLINRADNLLYEQKKHRKDR